MQCLISAAVVRVHEISWKKDHVGCVTSYDPRFGQWRRCYNVSRVAWKLLEEDDTPYQERLGSCLKKTLRCIKSVSGVTWRRCYDVSRAPWELLEEDVTMYQERLGSCLKKMLRCIKSVLEVTWRRCCNVAMLQRLWNADERTLLHSPQNTPFAKVTTVPTLEGRRHRKHLISSHDPTKSYDIIWHHMTSYDIIWNQELMVTIGSIW